MSGPPSVTGPRLAEDSGAAHAHVNDPLAEYVERVGVALESTLPTRSAGRLLAWLLTCKPPAQSDKQLCLALSSTPCTIRSDLDALVRAGYVEEVDHPRPSAPHYHLRPDAWRATLALPDDSATERRMLVEEGLELLAQSTPEHRQRLMSMHQVFAFVEAHFLSATHLTGHNGSPPQLAHAPQGRHNGWDCS